MLANKEIGNELMEISPLLADAVRINPYVVPAGYFEGLDEHLLTLAKIDDRSPALHSIAMKNPMQVPHGYFDTLAESILHKIKKDESQSVDDELRVLSLMLYSLDKVNVYKVPAGYFDTLSDTLISRVSPKEEAKIISFKEHKSIKWMRYAVAAAVIGIIGFFAFYFTNGNSKLDSVVKQGISYAKENKFDEVLNKTSEDAIANYLDKTADDADAIQMVASVDQSQLPDEEELMSDEKLMDELLKESKNKTSN
ncbi:MAG: DUF4179 domain-containing protein [Sphingobacteriales bacterium]|nr:DUF4179 domain-containing protein [Sphingobacteriales bacterium]